MEAKAITEKIKYLILLLLPLFVFLAVSLQPIHAETPLRLNTYTGPPLSNKSRTGLYDLIIIEAFRRIGLEVIISHLPAERSLINANLGLDDGDFVRISGLNKIYPNLIRVPEKITDYEFTAFTKNIDMRPEHWSSLRPYHLGIVRGWKILEENLKGVTRLFKVKNQHLLFNMLNNERVDIIIYSKFEGYWIIRKFGYASIRALSPPLVTREMFLYLNKRHINLISGIDQALKSMKSDGTFSQIVSKTLAPFNLEANDE
jgi:polar amino acid transport system substrate-binding protein